MQEAVVISRPSVGGNGCRAMAALRLTGKLALTYTYPGSVGEILILAAYGHFKFIKLSHNLTLKEELRYLKLSFLNLFSLPPPLILNPGSFLPLPGLLFLTGKD